MSRQLQPSRRELNIPSRHTQPIQIFPFRRWLSALLGTGRCQIDFSWSIHLDSDRYSGTGVYTFKVQVSDGTATTESSIALTVTEDNVAPVLTDVPATATIPEGVEYTFTAHATDSDLPVQTLAFSLSGEPAGASITSAGVFTWTPADAQDPGFIRSRFRYPMVPQQRNHRLL